jgi:hypothetical protein
VPFYPLLKRIAARLNAERVVFLLAAGWLLAMGVGFTHAPEIPEWGPARTGERPADIVSLDVDSTMPFPEGGIDPFGGPGKDSETKAGGAGGGGDNSGWGGDDDVEIDDEEVAAGDEDDDPTSEPVDKDKRADPPRAAPPRFLGSLSVEDSGTYTFVADGDEYVAVGPGGGEAGRYRLVERSASYLLLEDASGVRIRVAIP